MLQYSIYMGNVRERNESTVYIFGAFIFLMVK